MNDIDLTNGVYPFDSPPLDYQAFGQIFYCSNMFRCEYNFADVALNRWLVLKPNFVLHLFNLACDVCCGCENFERLLFERNYLATNSIATGIFRHDFDSDTEMWWYCVFVYGIRLLCKQFIESIYGITWFIFSFFYQSA